MPDRFSAAVAAVVLLVLLSLAGLTGCASPVPARSFDNQLSFDRSYDIALASMADQRLIFSVQDRRQGRIVGSIDGVTLIAGVEPVIDGSTRVSFSTQGSGAADAAMLARVIEAYNGRMEKLGVLGGFKDSGGSNRPVPCPSGPAFCP